MYQEDVLIPIKKASQVLLPIFFLKFLFFLFRVFVLS
jgi:hypothetical protein